MQDTVVRYAPVEVMKRGIMMPVISTRAYPSGQHPKHCPLVSGCVALELVTHLGSRWFGFFDAWINSELRMVVRGCNPKFEGGPINWEPVPGDRIDK
tara:strand:+ start:18057 stop:18347 length:291 start_codon:yes stop_codon:yes gene_type:complete